MESHDTAMLHVCCCYLLSSALCDTRCRTVRRGGSMLVLPFFGPGATPPVWGEESRLITPPRLALLKSRSSSSTWWRQGNKNWLYKFLIIGCTKWNKVPLTPQALLFLIVQWMSLQAHVLVVTECSNFVWALTLLHSHHKVFCSWYFSASKLPLI